MYGHKVENISAVISYIEAHLNEKLSLDTVAKAAGYSKYHLHRMFTSTVGMTLHDYIKRRQLTEAGYCTRSGRFILFSCVAMGLLQMLSLRFSDSLNLSDFRYLRTRSSLAASEGTTMCFLRRNLFRLIALRPDLAVSRIILSKSDISALHRVA